MVDTPVVEIHYDGAWQDITDRVTGRGSWVQITRGRGDEMTRSRPSTLSLSLDNRDGRFAPRNAASPLFGKIGRNTPIRVRFTPAQSSLQVGGGGYASTPDDPALDITGDIDWRLGLHPRVWRASSEESIRGLARKYRIADDQRSWAITLRDDGTIRLLWSPDGTLASRITATSSAAIPADTDDIAIRITIDVDNGAGGNDVEFFTAPDISGPWTQLGSTVTTAGTTSVHAGTADVELGRVTPGGLISSDLDGTVTAFELRDGIDGTVVANPDFTELEAGTGEFEDSAGRTWTVHSPAWITDPQVRFTGEVSQWPQRWTSELDVWVPLEAAGILRRLSQGQQSLRSSLFRDLSTRDEVVAYWPMEDGENADQFASAFADGDTLTPYGDGEIHPASYDGFAASDPIPEWTDGQVQGSAGGYEGADRQRIMMLLHVPEDGVADDRRIFLVRTRSSSLWQWWVYLTSAGGLRLRIEDDSSGTTLDSTFGFDLNGDHVLITLLLEQNGSSVDWGLATFGLTGGAGGASGTETGVYERMTRIAVGAPSGLNRCAIGHVTVINDDTDTIWDLGDRSLAAWSGEAAVDRIVRLCAEEDVPLAVVGADSEAVGPQLPDNLLNLAGDAADVDLGPLGDARDVTDVHYRARETLYNQPEVVLDYEARQAWRPLNPTDDDQAIRNDITVTRVGGSSARAVRESGPMSIQSPPDGVGHYPSGVTLNLSDDGQLSGQAAWRLHLGTVDEQRVPTLTVLLHAPAVAGMVDDILALDVGDRIQIINTPPWLPGPVDLLVQGYTETITGVEHVIAYTCTPASPWTVGLISDGADEQRADTDASETFGTFDVGVDIALDIAYTAGPQWTEDPAELPLHIQVHGVVLNVTAITTVSGSWQQMTVDQTPVSGPTGGTIPVGTDVRLAQPMIIGL